MKLPAKKIHLFLLCVVLAVAVFFRFWMIRDYVVFLGDEGRDMIVMRNMLLTLRPVFLGPTASVGGFYLGPIYYWMAAPFLLLSNFDPVGPSYMVALFGVATVFLLYKFTKELAGFYPAILISLLYSSAPLIVRYSRSSWNPNPLPFFALLLVYSLYRGIKTQKWVYFLLAGLSFGVAIQLHYLAIMLVPVSAVIIVLNLNYKKWPKLILLAAAGFLITFSPFLVFELKHEFPNFKSILEFTTRKTTHGFRSSNIFWIVSNFGNIFLENITKLQGTIITRFLFWILTIGSVVISSFTFKDREKRLKYTLPTVWFVGGLLALRFYSGQIFDYYYGFLFPAPFLLLGVLFSIFWKNNIVKMALVVLTGISFIWFLNNGFYKGEPNQLINQTEKVVNLVIEKSQNKPFNFALITDHNSDHAYRYFLDIKGHKPTDLEKMVTDQLLVVCESKDCRPLGYPSWEIAGFGRAEVQDQWEIPNIGITVIRLLHWPGVPSPAGKPAIKG